MSGLRPFGSKTGWAERAMEWKKTASSMAGTTAWPAPPSMAWYGQMTSAYFPFASSRRQ